MFQALSFKSVYEYNASLESEKNTKHWKTFSDIGGAIAQLRSRFRELQPEVKIEGVSPKQQKHEEVFDSI